MTRPMTPEEYVTHVAERLRQRREADRYAAETQRFLDSLTTGQEPAISMNTLILWEAMLIEHHTGNSADLDKVFTELGTFLMRALAIGLTDLFEKTWDELTPFSRALFGSINSDYARTFVINFDWIEDFDFTKDTDAAAYAKGIDEGVKRLTRRH